MLQLRRRHLAHALGRHGQRGTPPRCIVDDQACLHAVLLSPTAERLGFVLDRKAELFLSMYAADERQLSLRDGRLVYLPTGSAPCMVHFNGHKGLLRTLMKGRLRNASWSIGY